MAGRDHHHTPANLRHRSYHHLSGHPPPELQTLSIQTLLHDKQRLSTSHEALKKEVAAAEHEVRLLAATSASVKAEREAQVREFYDRCFRLEAEVRSIDGIPAELDRVRADVVELRADKEGMLGKLRDIDGDLKRTHLELELLGVLKGEIDAMQKEIRRGRAAVDYERKLHIKNSEMKVAMEKHMVSLSQEAQKLRSELADAEKRAMAAAAAAVTAPSSDPGYGYGYAMYPGGSNHVYGGNPIPDPYAVHQGSVEAHLQYGMGVGPHGPPGMGVGPHGPPGVGVGSHGPPGAYVVQGQHLHN